jgi:hypothetical protein
MLSESKVRSERLLRGGVQLLVVSAFTLFLPGAAEQPAITGTWKADVSKTSPPDNNELAVTLTIKEIGLRTYTIRVDRQTTERGLVSEETTIACDGRSRPLGKADSGGALLNVFCARGGANPLSIRVMQGYKTLREQVFSASGDGNSLNYTKTEDGHDRTYVFSRQ